MQAITFNNLQLKFEHQQQLLNALRKENQSLRAKLQIKETKLKNLKITLRKIATGL